MAKQRAAAETDVRERRPFTAENVGKIVLAAAVGVFAASVVYSVLSMGIQGRSVVVGEIVTDQVDDIPYHAALFGAVLWASLTQGSTDALVKGSIVVYVGSVANSVLNVVFSEFARGGLGTLLGPVHSVIFFVGFVMAIRLYHGKTVLPGVEFRL